MNASADSAVSSSVIWVIDKSSIIEVRRSVPNVHKKRAFREMKRLVEEGRLIYPSRVMDELERLVDRDAPDPQYAWTRDNVEKACQLAAPLADPKEVFKVVPDVVDEDKDTGIDEADPYVLAMAVRLKREQKEVRIITEEKNDTPRRMSLSTAAGLLGIPAAPLRAVLDFQGILKRGEPYSKLP